MSDYERIWLQSEENSITDPAYEGRTWCRDSVNEDDTEYVRADLFAALEAQLAKLEAEKVNGTFWEKALEKANKSDQQRIAELQSQLAERGVEVGRLRGEADLVGFYWKHHMNYGGQQHWIIDSPLGMQWRLCEWDGSEFVHVETDAERKDFPTPQDAIREARRRSIRDGGWTAHDAD